MFTVRIVGDTKEGKKTRVSDNSHTIPAQDKEEAIAWGHKQAQAVGTENPMITAKES